MDLASRQYTCSHGTDCEGVFSYLTNNPVGTPCLFTGSSPSDCFLFSKIKEILKGRHFDDIDDITINTTAALKAIPQKLVPKLF